MRQTTCLVVNPITGYNFADLSNRTPVDRASDLNNDGSGIKLSVKLTGA